VKIYSINLAKLKRMFGTGSSDNFKAKSNRRSFRNL
jgi:hypothetical protein